MAFTAREERSLEVAFGAHVWHACHVQPYAELLLDRRLTQEELTSLLGWPYPLRNAEVVDRGAKQPRPHE